MPIGELAERIPGGVYGPSLELLGGAGASVLTGVVASSACGKEDDGGWR